MLGSDEGRLVAVGRGVGSLARRLAVLAMMLATTVWASPVFGQRSGDTPVFRGGTELVMIDLQIAPRRGAELRDFVASDFTVEISGRRRTEFGVARLHFDEGSVVRDPARAPGSTPACVFGFHRRRDTRIAHYLIGVDAIEADRAEVRRVRVTLNDEAFEVVFTLWRSPLRRVGHAPGGVLGRQAVSTAPHLSATIG